MYVFPSTFPFWIVDDPTFPPPSAAPLRAMVAMTPWLFSFSDNKRHKNTTNKPKPNVDHENIINKYTKSLFFWTPYHHHHHNDQTDLPKHNILGILAFDAARAMSDLIAIYRALSDAEVTRFRRNICSRGVAYLISPNEAFLLSLACAERLEDLDRAADWVARLGSKCSDGCLARFDTVYRGLKQGHVNLDKLYNSGTKEMDRSLGKVEKLIVTTSHLYAEMEALSQLEASERRLNEWKQSKAPAAAAGTEAEAAQSASVQAFEQRIAAQRKLVRQLKESSMWSRSYDKTVGIAARVICVVFARICAHFGPYVAVLPKVNNGTGHARSKSDWHFSHLVARDPGDFRVAYSAPLNGSGSSGFETKATDGQVSVLESTVRDLTLLEANKEEGTRCGNGGEAFVTRDRNRVFQVASPSTVGGSGLTSRYADIITLAQKYLKSECIIGEEARDRLYNMLPTRLRAQVKRKLKKSWRSVEDEARRCDGEALAVGWREAVEGILQWLGPMAKDTLTWLSSMNMEKQSFESQRTVLLLQTLHFANLEKTEAAIAEVLVGLSCIHRYENRSVISGGGGDGRD